MMKLSKFMKCFNAMMLIAFGMYLHSCLFQGPRHVECDKFDEKLLNSWLAHRMVPEKATKIVFDEIPCMPGTCFGGRATCRCYVSRTNLLEFAKSNGYEFQDKSISSSSRSTFERYYAGILPEKGVFYYDANMNEIPDGRPENGEWYQVYFGYESMPTNFLSYDHFLPSGRGFAFLYDDDAGILYGYWSSN